MSLLSELKTPGHVGEAIIHYNHALDKKDGGLPKVDVARALFDGLNKLQTEWLMGQQDQQVGEVKRYQLMILSELQAELRRGFLRSDELRALVLLEPQIMNHDTLRDGGYRPGIEIEPRLAKKAAEEHRKLVTAYHKLERNSGLEIEERVIKRAAELMYVVRSNIAHGEKTSNGPDLAKKDRDEQVCLSVIPLQELLFDYLLDRPSRRLVSYGTLAPGQRNQQLVADVPGNWEECSIRGLIHVDRGLSTFSWNPVGSEVKASLFSSTDLPTLWHKIDAFEGSGYKRRLIPAKTQAGIVIANVYTGS